MSELDALTDAMAARGLVPPSHFEPGKIQRVAESDHPKSDTAGWIRLFPDGQGAVFGSHRSGWQETWQAKRDKPMSAQEKRDWQKQVKEARKAAEDEREREYQATALEAAKRWEAGSPASADNAYLAKKQVQVFGTRQDDHGNLIVPVHDASGCIQSLQTIRPDGEKRFLKSGRMAAGRYWLQEPVTDDAPILLGEGFGTMASIAEALPEAGVCMAFSAKNLPPVAKSIRDQHPTRRIVVCGDNDASETGQAAAHEAAQAIGATVALPADVGADFNDIHIRDGIAAVRDAIDDAMAAPGPQRLSADDIDEAAKAEHQEQENAPATAMAELLEIAQAGDAPAFWRAFKTRAGAVQEAAATDPVEFAAWRSEVKTACGKINVGTLDSLLNPKGEGGGSDSQATQLADLAAEKCDLWHDKDGEAYASLTRDNHCEHWKIDSLGFRDWLAWLAHTELDVAPSGETIKAACNALAGKAKFDGDEYEPCRRVGKTPDGYWLDMGDDQWRAIQITATGWRIVENPPIRFLRTKATRALPEPLSGGDLDALWDVTNIPENERLLVLAWLLECWRSDTPYSLLELTGEQGSAKSSTQTTLRRFVDPSEVALRGKPKTVEDIFVAARNSHLLSYENLSSITNDQSDALCTCCTGGGHAARQLYTNGEEALLKAHCPVALNGISPVVLRPDLLDRSVSILLPVIQSRKTEEELEAEVEQAAPGIMGGLLDLFANALAELPNIHIPHSERPRMADFALLGEAIARVRDYPDGAFLNIYSEHRKTAISRTVDASPVATALVAFVDRGNSYQGTVKGLLELLNENRPDHERDDYWPRSPKGLADALRRYAPALRQLDITARVDNTRRMDGIHCTVRGYISPEPQTPGNEVHEVHEVHGVHGVHGTPKTNPDPEEICPQCQGAGCPLCWDVPAYADENAEEI